MGGDTNEEVTRWPGRDPGGGHLRIRKDSRLINRRAIDFKSCCSVAVLSTGIWAWTELGLNPSTVTRYLWRLDQVTSPL